MVEVKLVSGAAKDAPALVTLEDFLFNPGWNHTHVLTREAERTSRGLCLCNEQSEFEDLPTFSRFVYEV